MSLPTSTSSYRNILKGTSIFGGVQIFNALIGVVRGKLVAMILGPEGMGISSLFVSTTSMLQQFSSLGLNLSALKEISVAREGGNQRYLSTVICVLRRLLVLTALLGSLLSILFSKQLSQFAFGSTDYTLHFILLSIMVYLTTLSNGELTILQGVRKLKQLAFSSVIGSACGLLISVPLYYIWGYDGIVPAMIVLSLCTYGFNRYFTSRIALTGNRPSWKRVFAMGRVMIQLGIVLMVSSLIGTSCNYLLNAFISNYGSLTDVGMYQAANSLTNQYVSLVFAAMGAEYFPRLAGVAKDNEKVCLMVNQQTEIVILIIAPLAAILIISAPIVIHLLLTEKFLPLESVIRWMGLGIFFKAMVFPMGYIAFAKGNKKLFFGLEGIYGNIVYYSLAAIFYALWGLKGLGIAMTVAYFHSVFVYFFINHKKYQFGFSSSVVRLMAILSLFMITIFILSLIDNLVIAYSGMITIGLICSVYCILELNKRINLIKIKKHNQ